MKKYCLYQILILILCVAFFGCAAPDFLPATFMPREFDMNRYEARVDNMLVLLDASSSMTQESYKGRAKINIAKDVVHSMNRTLPDLDMEAGMRVFGQCVSGRWEYTSLIYGMSRYGELQLNEAINMVQGTGLITPMGEAFEGAVEDLQDTRGPIAVILVSDGQDPEIPGLPVDDEVRTLKEAYGDRLCIYTVGIGQDCGGIQRLKKIAAMGGCGFYINADDLSSAGSMADFVEKVFLSGLEDSDGDGVVDKEDQCPGTPPGTEVDERGCPLPEKKPAPAKPVDNDGDGVPDIRDKCPNTPKGVPVDADGCRILGKVHFDFDRSNIKPAYEPVLVEAARMLEDNPSVDLEIHGHTDGIGTEEYNQGLSERRARSARQYLIGEGIDGRRLSIRGHSFRRPMATNETPQGRALNRRVEMKPMSR